MTWVYLLLCVLGVIVGLALLAVLGVYLVTKWSSSDDAPEEPALLAQRAEQGKEK